MHLIHDIHSIAVMLSVVLTTGSFTKLEVLVRITNLPVSRSGIEHARILSEKEIGEKIERGFCDQNRSLGEQVDRDFEDMHNRCKKGDTKYDTERVVCDPRKPRKM